MQALIECAARSAALIAIVWCVHKLLRVRSTRLERNSWLMVLACSAAMPLLTTLAASSSIHAGTLPWPQSIPLVALAVPDTNIEWRTALLRILIAVAAVLGIRQALGILRWWRVRRAALPVSSPLCAGFDVRVTPTVNSPATVFSTILVPIDFDSWAPEVQRAVIAHEGAHVENRDFYVQCAAHLHRCIFWFSPLSWWLAGRLSLLSEHISDDAAIAVTEVRAEYAEVLLGFAQRMTHGDHLLPMAGNRTFASRIERILADRASPGAGLAKTLLLATVLLAVVTLVAGSWPAAARSTGDFRHATASVVLPKSNPQRPLSQPVYPPASRRLAEHGTVILSLHVLEDGSVADVRIDESSGYPDLDYAAFYESFRWKLDPGTVEDVPSRMWGRFAVTFKLTDA